MKRRLAGSSLALCLLAGNATAEVVTGQFSQSNFTSGQLLGIPVEVESTGWSHGGMSFSEIGFVHSSINRFGAAAFLLSDNDDRRYFEEGQTLSANGDWAEGGYVQWGMSEYDWYFDKTYYLGFPGDVGEMIYVGFAFDMPVNGGPVTIRNVGFLQLYQYERAHYEVIGYAYETEANGSIQAFNLIPTPGASTVLGLGMLVACQRRRSA